MTVPARASVDECESSITRHSQSFSLASKLLPSACRYDAQVLYAWCRRADDAVDDATPESKQAAVARLFGEVQQIYAAALPPDPVLLAFQEVSQKHQIPVEYPRALIKGMAMDASGTFYESIDELYKYCFRVAGTVGLMMCHVMGTRRPEALRYAADLGIAMQLTNICRDVQEDWMRSRLYLPDELLRGVGLGNLARALGGPLPPYAVDGCRVVVRSLLEEAEARYASAARGLVYLPARCAFAVDAARLIYAGIGDGIARQNYDVTASRAFVPGWRKGALLLRAAARALALRKPPFQPAPFTLQHSVEHVASAFPL